ncbi:hypothetical protein, partial [Peribacillus frigoritolerans]|uniref:hypothetical protein n=1 Tax=Peribacillus frigoritolerans TaxID=450367 RepID=UPI001F4F2C43
GANGLVDGVQAPRAGTFYPSYRYHISIYKLFNQKYLADLIIRTGQDSSTSTVFSNYDELLKGFFETC